MLALDLTFDGAVDMLALDLTFDGAVDIGLFGDEPWMDVWQLAVAGQTPPQ